MENQRDKFRKLENKNYWADLPRDILGFILGKLPSAGDVIRFRAVCKKWQIPKDRVIKYKQHFCLPWLCSLSRDSRRLLKCKMFVCNSSGVIETRKSTVNIRRLRYYLEVYGSKKGWLIAATFSDDLLEKFILMYHPYSKEIIPLPYLEKYMPRFATFSGHPGSQDCQVFILVQSEYNIAICQLDVSSRRNWRINKFLETRNECRGMEYMDGYLLILFNDATLGRYNVADGTWTELNRGQKRVKIDHSKEQLWLIKGEGDVLVACKLNLADGIGSSFCFDWFNMEWVENSLFGTTIFISGEIGMMRPLVDECDSTEDCRIFFFNNKCYKCYSFVRGRMMGSRVYDVSPEDPYPSMTFIEPPRIS